MQRGRLFYFVITHDRPEEADEFAGYRNDGDVRCGEKSCRDDLSTAIESCTGLGVNP